MKSKILVFLAGVCLGMSIIDSVHHHYGLFVLGLFITSLELLAAWVVD